MKNLHALNSKNQLIQIDDVDKELQQKYFCCNCGDELIARKGKINSHHFAHKNKLECNYETYLHKVSKIKFYDNYLQCLKNNKPFYLEYSTKQICNSCLNDQRLRIFCNLFDKIERYDLTKTFDKIEIEKGYNGFIPDLQLKSSKLNEVIFIEIAVTHKCEEVKLKSGIRIIEFKVNEEIDLNALSTNQFKLNQKNVNYYNFKSKIREANIINSNDCKMQFDVFYVLKNKKAYKIGLPMYQIRFELNELDFEYYEIIKTPEKYWKRKELIDFVRESSRKGINVKNCYACRFYAENNRNDGIFEIFCKKHKAEVKDSNDGASCSKFWRIENKPTHNNV